MTKYRFVVQTRFRSSHYTQPWLTISYHEKQSGADAALAWHNEHNKNRFTEYRIEKL